MGPGRPLRNRAPAGGPLALSPERAVGLRGRPGPDPPTPRRRPAQLGKRGEFPPQCGGDVPPAGPGQTRESGPGRSQVAARRRFPVRNAERRDDRPGVKPGGSLCDCRFRPPSTRPSLRWGKGGRFVVHRAFCSRPRRSPTPCPRQGERARMVDEGRAEGRGSDRCETPRGSAKRIEATPTTG
jgi:hypothetical protein